MSHPRPEHFRWLRRLAASLCAALALGSIPQAARAHIVPPEDLHPVVESYRRLGFVLNLNPVRWEVVEQDAATLADGLSAVAPEDADVYRQRILELIADHSATDGAEPPGPAERKATAREVFELSTRAVIAKLRRHLETAGTSLEDYRRAAAEVAEARRLWAAFEHEVRATDREAYERIGRCWLELTEALGHPGFLGVGEVAPDAETFGDESREIVDYLEAGFRELPGELALRLAPIPAHSPTFDRSARLPARLPPGSNVNKQLPRPRQVLNMAARGVDESETALIALGDMAFDSHAIFGEPARSLGITCNTCHNKSITNPGFFIPGLSARPGGMDVSNSFFAPHAGNGHFDPVDIPDLRGIRFTSPYGRNGRFESLREFTRNVIVNEFNGPEPDPVLLDGLVAYMLEFDFLPNPYLGRDGRLNANAPEAARRGEAIFHRPFARMGDRSCASCHVPSDHFVDRKRHDLGTVAGAEPFSRDGALDTPTLLSVAYTGPYFHDGRFDTLGEVVAWFDERFALGLSEAERGDLTAYVETVGEGLEAYEDTVHTLEAELEEFGFFLSAYDFLTDRGKRDLIDVTFQTVAYEIRAHKWDVQDRQYLGVLDRMAALMDQALAANRRGDAAQVDARIAEYRRVYEEHKEVLR